MIIREKQMELISNVRFQRKLIAFLKERTVNPMLSEALHNEEQVFELWSSLWETIGHASEYQTAVLLTFGLCQSLRGVNPLAAVRSLVSQKQPEYEAKSYLEDSGFLRFSEFDLENDEM